MIPENIKSLKVEVTVTGEDGVPRQLLLIEGDNSPEKLDSDVTIGGGVPGAKVVNNILLLALKAVRETAELGAPDAKGGTH